MSTLGRYREWPLFCRCERCRDLVTVYLWIKQDARGRYEAILEGSQDVKKQDGQIIHNHHNCGGVMRGVEPLPGPTRLV